MGLGMNRPESGVWFPPGASVVHLPTGDRRGAQLGLTMYAASSRPILAAQWLAWAWIRTLGPSRLPGRRQPIDVPELGDISAALGYGPPRSVAIYRRRDVRGGVTFLAVWPGRAHLIKVRQDGAALESEQRLLDTVQQVRPASFRSPRPIGFGSLPDGRYWAAQDAVFTAPHRSCLELSEDLQRDLATVLASGTTASAAASSDVEPSHGDLSPWNLRRDHRGDLWLFDWEDAGVAPVGADRAYFYAAVGVLRPRAPMPDVDPRGTAYWADRLRCRLKEGHPQRPNEIMLARLETALPATHGGHDANRVAAIQKGRRG